MAKTVAYEIPYANIDRAYFCIECGPVAQEKYGSEVREIEDSQYRWPIQESCDECGENLFRQALRADN